MKFSVVYNKSGDIIPFNALSPDTFEMISYYVQNLDDNNLNTFKTLKELDLSKRCKELRDAITDANSFIYPFTETVISEIHNNEDCLDPDVLNKLHADWANSQSIEYNIQDKKEKYGNVSDLVNVVREFYSDDILTTTVGSALSRLGISDRYGKINKHVHTVELLFRRVQYRVAEQDWVEFNNPFDKALATNDICNFNLDYFHLGRPLNGKWNTFDTDLKYDDENSFNELTGNVAISLKQPQTIPFSKEFIAWCKEHNKTPASKNLGIGNIPDIQNNVTEYRKVMYRNITDANTFSIVIN